MNTTVPSRARLLALFERCLSVPYQSVKGANYAVERVGDTLYLYFQDSDGAVDWRRNLRFLPRAYHLPAEAAERKGKCYAHRGFLTAFRLVLPCLLPRLLDPSVRRMVITGYSHGAAQALLCYEYVCACRKDLAGEVTGYGFGCPRVLWGGRRREGYAGFWRVHIRGDLVTRVPPAALGFYHVGKACPLPREEGASAVDAHRPEYLLRALQGLPEEGKAAKWQSLDGTPERRKEGIGILHKNTRQPM